MAEWSVNLLKNTSLLIIVSALAVLFMPELACAAGGNLTCAANGAVSQGSLFDTTPSGLCMNQSDFLHHLFSNIICMFVSIIDGVLSAIYCGIQFGIKTPLSAVMVLYVAIFGVQILTGQTQLTGGEIVARVVKLAFVWYFATNASYGIGIGFNFFLGLLNDSILWVLSAVIPGATTVITGYQYIDAIVYQALIGPIAQADSKVIGLFFVMAVAFPPVFLMGLAFMWQTAMLLISCIVIFLLSVSAIAFLISLSPIFLSFMLFQSTFYLFENWLRYMISYSLQVTVVFAIVAMWVKIISNFSHFFVDLESLIFPYNELLVTGPGGQPTSNWGVCKLIYGINAFGPTAQCDPNADPSDLTPPSRISEIKGLIYYIIFHMTTLILIAYAFRILLRNASQIARDLVGPAYVPMLGRGFGMAALGEPSSYPRRALMRSMGGSDPALRRR